MIPLDRVRELSEGLADVESAAEVHDLARDVLALADALATAERERDTARASADRSAQAAVDAARELGHAAAQAVADRDAVRQAHAELAAAVREYLATDGDRPLDEAETHALDRLDALLSDAPAPSTVSAALVRAYLAAHDRVPWAVACDGPQLEREAEARAALEAALARCP